MLSRMKVRTFIQKLGGPVAVGNHLGIRSQAVSHWSAADVIPVSRVPALLRLARKLGVKVTAKQICPGVDWSVFK